MRERRDELIAALSADLEPVTNPGRTAMRAILWLVLAAFVCAMMFALSPARPGAGAALLESGQFALESMLGLAAILALAQAAFHSGIPSNQPMLRRAAVALVLLASWVGVCVYGIVDPALTPGMIGKRPHCWFETLALAAPGFALGMYWIAREWPLRGAWSGLLLGLAAGCLPALMMQFACMYEPIHVLVLHVLPGLSVGVVGALIGHWWLRPR